MSDKNSVRFYLEDPLRQSAVAGAHNFINLMAEVMQKARFRVEYHRLPIMDHPDGAYAMCHMINPPDSRGLLFRRVYHYPFWQIEAVAQRWQWDTARAPFDLHKAPEEAQRFYQFWQKRLFGDAPAAARREGYIYVPLQAHLNRQRVFQSCAPLEMLQHCINHANARRIVATLHPKETYTATDLKKLSILEQKHPNLTVETGHMVRHLQACDFVVTQNSGVAFSGYFFGKPALLFGKIDFHHIAVSADLSNLATSFAQIADHTPPYAQYLWWFWQDQSINAGRPDAKDKIAARLRRFGWDV